MSHHKSDDPPCPPPALHHAAVAAAAAAAATTVETPASSHAQMRAHTHDVQTPLPLTPTTKTVVGVPPSVTQKVTWKDALFPRVFPTRVQCTPQ
jgi:hypothetical protein